MKVVITGASKGIGSACVDKFLSEGWEVIGIDIDGYTSNIHPNYTHIQFDIRKNVGLFPDINDVDVLINNAGVQNTGHDIETNLIGLMNCTEKYGLQPNIKAIVNQASVSAHNGAEFGEYVASKGGVLSYTLWTAKEIAKYGATCNSFSFGGVITDLNASVLDDSVKWSEIMNMTPLKKWCSAEEAADWIYFVAVNNQSMTGQDIIIDNGEMINHKFVW